MTPQPTAASLRERLTRLQAERVEARDSELWDNRLYMADLEAEIDHYRAAFVGAAVTEIASLRAELSGPLLG